MMLMMVVFAVISAGLFYASRVPAVQDDISALTSKQSYSDFTDTLIVIIVPC